MTLALNRVYNTDCMEGMNQITAMSIDAIITDPPYMIGARSVGTGKINPWSDYCNAAFWYAAWLGRARKLLKPTGCLWTFLNWRSIVTFQKAAADLDWPIESMLVWDKGWIGPGGEKGLRPSYELVALFPMPDFKITDRSLPDIQRFKWSSSKPHGHPAEKPEELIKWLVAISTKPGMLICDLFSGSGTTGAASAKAGRNFIGFETDLNWCNFANKRLEAAKSQQSLFRQII